MARCSGSYSVGKAINATKTLAGKGAHSAEHEKACFAASGSTAARFPSRLSPNFRPSQFGISTGTAKLTSKTWMLSERTLIERMSNEMRRFPGVTGPRESDNQAPWAGDALNPSCWVWNNEGGNEGGNEGDTETRSTRKRHRSENITLRQATNLTSALHFARKIGTPLNVHATIHWCGTAKRNDPDGSLFARVREGFDKWLTRSGVPGGLTCVWVRERNLGGCGDGEHCHMLFHLAHPFFRGRKYKEVLRSLERLVARHGGGNYASYTVNLKVHLNPDGVYLLKGGGPEVWRRFAVPMEWRTSQGIIFGKRCGTTENIGSAARSRWHKTNGTGQNR
jgi:hypothetical protein